MQNTFKKFGCDGDRLEFRVRKATKKPTDVDDESSSDSFDFVPKFRPLPKKATKPKTIRTTDEQLTAKLRTAFFPPEETERRQQARDVHLKYLQAKKPAREANFRLRQTEKQIRIANNRIRKAKLQFKKERKRRRKRAATRDDRTWTEKKMRKKILRQLKKAKKRGDDVDVETLTSSLQLFTDLRAAIDGAKREAKRCATE